MKAAAVVVAAVLASGSAASAAWQKTSSGSGAAHSTTIAGGGNVPTGSVSSHNVTVSWAATSYGSGAAVGKYIVKRYDSLTGTPQTVGAGCSGTVSGTSCTETGVPTGTWQYTVTPAPGNWRGAESPKSAVVIVTV